MGEVEEVGEVGDQGAGLSEMGNVCLRQTCRGNIVTTIGGVDTSRAAIERVCGCGCAAASTRAAISCACWPSK